MILSFISCRHYQRTSTVGKQKTTYYNIRYPARGTSYTIIGNKITIDTVDNYVVSKSRYKTRMGCFRIETIRQKTIIYNKKHQRIEKIVLRHGKRKTVEYFKNYEKTIVKISDTDTLNINIDSMKIK